MSGNKADEKPMSQPAAVPLPKRTGADAGYTVAKTLLSSIPFVGSPAAELFSALIAPPLQRRRDVWFGQIAERLARLEQEGRVSIDDLQNNEAFVTTFVQASQVAVRNHQQEKIDALRNAVLNSGTGPAPDNSKREMFLAFVDTFTVWHLTVLAFLNDPSRWVTQHGLNMQGNLVCKTVEAALYNQFAELYREPEFRKVLIRDLRSRSLIQADDSGFEFSGAESGRCTPATTRLGREFIRFISEPTAGSR